MSVDQVQGSGLPQVERFDILERLGSGGMGVVYRALDRTTQLQLAIKFLSRLDGDSLYRFKKEFRALADLSHPNLVDLYELHSVADQWCFTMELVDGVRFDEYLGATAGPPDATPTTPTMETPDRAVLARLASAPPVLPDTPPASGSYRVPEQLWPALAQLVEGVQALHRAGILHRDIKPSNVLVTGSGRVVLCDFGLVMEVQTEARDHTSEDNTVMGTPMYMSPEQAAGRQVSEATDWYGVGVMLYQALTGRLPFSGDAVQVLWLKGSSEPPPPSHFNPAITPELDALCTALLRRDPAARASGRDIQAYLGRRAAPPRAASADPAGTPFVGRAREQERLREALAATRGGHCVTVLVLGLSGMGKTALVRRFLDEVRADPDAVVLAGRCYEREEVPYKALDTIVDALSTHLLRLPAEEIERVLPGEIGALARLFPVMRRVNAVAQPAQRTLDSPDPHESRRRALGALRHILQRLAERHPVVLFVDDLQWGDMDSAPFLADLMHHADAPPVLLLTSCRREDADSSPLLQALLHPQRATAGASGDLREIALEPLSHDEAEALGRKVLPANEVEQERRAARIADDSGGSPLFVLELARAGALAATGLRLEAVMLERIGRLPEPARALLTALVVAGRPTPQAVLAGSLGVSIEPALVNLLRAERLVRTSSGGADPQLEPYHDRIREALFGQLSSHDRRRVHRALATAFEQRPGTDPQTLLEHWAGAGYDEQAGRYALLAATRAEDALAFHRAVTYYEQALRLRPGSPAEARRVKARLATALLNAGRLGDAAALSLEAAADADPIEALQLRRQAMESLLLAGRLKEGLDTATEVARGVGLDMPRTLRGALWAMATGRLAVRLHGLGFQARPSEEIPPEQLRRLDVCWSLSQGISFVDPLLGMGFQARHLREALNAGDPYRVSLALSTEIGYRSIRGTRSWRAVEPLFAPATALAQRTGSPQAIAFCAASIALAHYLSGHWRPAIVLCRQAERLWSDHGTEMRSATDVLQVYLVSAMIQVGETREVESRLGRYLEEALERGDHYAATALKTWRSNIAWLLMDRPDDARRLALETSLQSMGEGVHLHHHHELLTQGHIDLYVGDYAAAWQRVEDIWPRLERSHLFRIQAVRTESEQLRAACALGWAAATPSARAGALRAAVRSTRRLEREHSPWADALASLLHAGIAAVRGERDTALAQLGVAAERFAAFDMALHAAVARRRRGELLGGDEGQQLVDAASAFMKQQGVVDPARFTAMYATGFSS